MYRYSSCIFKSDNDNMWYPVLNHALFMEFWHYLWSFGNQLNVRYKKIPGYKISDTKKMIMLLSGYTNKTTTQWYIHIYIDTYSMFFQHGLCDTASSRNMIGKLTNNNVFSVTNYVCYYDYQMPAAFFCSERK